MRLHVHEFTNERALCLVRNVHGDLDYVHMPIFHMQNCLKSLLPYEGSTIKTNDKYNVHCTSSTPNEFEINLIRPSSEEDHKDADHVLSVYVTPSGYKILHAHHIAAKAGNHAKGSYDKYTLHSSLAQCIHKVTAELLPMYSTCVKMSSLIQESSSESLLNLIQREDSNQTTVTEFRRPLSDQFLQDNDTVISTLTDLLNQCVDKHFCYKYAAKLIQLGGLFCVGAQSGKATCLHVNEFRNFKPSARMLQLVRDQVPLKRGVTVLTKGESQAIRMYRHNLTVRLFNLQSPLTQCISAESMPLNGHIGSDVMVINGPFNDQLAIICLGQENFTSNHINAFLHTFYC